VLVAYSVSFDFIRSCSFRLVIRRRFVHAWAAVLATPRPVG